jgi:phenylacetic acid degradation operon negative regulatory protein
MLSIKEWLDGMLQADPPRAKSLVMTIFGDAIVPHGGRLWLGSLIELVGPLGATDRLVRTSVFRLVQDGWLVASREGRRSSYALEPEAQPRFARANRRIYAPPGLDWDGRWTLLMAPNGSIDAGLRAAVRKELEWEGYAMLAPGLLAHPAGDAASLAEILARVDGAGKVFVCSATELPGVGGRPLGELVREGWNLDGVVTGYRRFIDDFTPLLALLQAGKAPQPWPGSDAYALAQAIYRLVWAPAEQHLMEVLRREDADAPQADTAFKARFGGLR